MNREQKIKAVEGIIGKTKAWECLYLEVADDILVDVKPRLATAIVDNLEVDIKEIRKIIFDNTYVDKGGFSGQYEVAGISKTANLITTDIIKIKE